MLNVGTPRPGPIEPSGDGPDAGPLLGAVAGYPNDGAGAPDSLAAMSG